MTEITTRSLCGQPTDTTAALLRGVGKQKHAHTHNTLLSEDGGKNRNQGSEYEVM